MDIAVATAHRAEGRAEVGADAVENRFAKGQPARLIADERGENVAFAQRHADRDAQRLLAATEKDAAVDFARAIEAGEFVIQHTGKQHDAIRFDVKLRRRGNVGMDLGSTYD